MDHKYRGACDACHIRKTRCTLNGPGACVNCQNVGRSCVFSLRDEMGRPRKLSSKSKDKVKKQPASAETSSGQQTSRSFEENGANGSEPILPTVPVRKEVDVWKSHQEMEDIHTDTPSNDSRSQGMPLTRNNSSSIVTDSFDPNRHLYESNGIVWQNAYMPGASSSLMTPPETSQNVVDLMMSLTDEDKAANDITMVQEFSHSAQQGFSGPQLTKQLTETMFELSVQTKFQWKHNDEDLVAQAAIFQTVTKLCQLIEVIVTLGIYGPPAATEQQMNSQSSAQTQTLRMLVATAIFTVISCYRSLEQAYRTLLFNQSVIGFQNCPTDDFWGDSMRRIEFTHYEPANLTRVINLVTMDFHMARLKNAFAILQLNEIDGHLDCGIYEGEIQKLRLSLQQTASFLRSS